MNKEAFTQASIAIVTASNHRTYLRARARTSGHGYSDSWQTPVGSGYRELAILSFLSLVLVLHKYDGIYLQFHHLHLADYRDRDKILELILSGP